MWGKIIHINQYLCQLSAEWVVKYRHTWYRQKILYRTSLYVTRVYLSIYREIQSLHILSHTLSAFIVIMYMFVSGVDSPEQCSMMVSWHTLNIDVLVCCVTITWLSKNTNNSVSFLNSALMSIALMAIGIIDCELHRSAFLKIIFYPNLKKKSHRAHASFPWSLLHQHRVCSDRS